MSTASVTDPTVSAPRLCVCLDERSLTGVVHEFGAAGWTVERSASLPDHPWLHHERRLLWVGAAEDRRCIDGVAERLVRGVSVVVETDDRRVATDLFDQCRRLATAEWFDAANPPVCLGLDAVHVALLLRIQRGDSVAAAARACHLSARTAARRLAEAKQQLGAATTGEAATRVGRRIQELQRAG